MRLMSRRCLIPVLLLALTVNVTLACGPAPTTSRRPTRYYVPPAVNATMVALEEEALATRGPLSNSSEVVDPKSCKFTDGQLFGSRAPWNQPIDQTRLASDSTAVIDYLEKNHTSKQRFRTDFSFVTYETTSATPRKPFTPSDAHYSPDCDTSDMPLIPGGRIEGEDGYACTHDGDCHLIVHVPDQCRLYEMWRANITEQGFAGGCTVAWDTRMDYGTEGRGLDCTSADASGMPIAPLLFTPTELAAGRINHAIRLILPNALIRKRVYVPPASHSTGATKGPAEAPPYGGRFRLRANYDTSGLSPGGKIVAEALKKYGMIIADGGQVSFTAVSDRESTAKWSTFGFGPLTMERLRWTDFQLVDAGPPREFKGNCQRIPTNR